MAGTQMQLEDWLDDLCVRFIINLPQEDLSSVARICFQVEEAQWFYEDFIRPLDPTLPSMTLRTFCLRIFQHCPLLASFSVENHTKAFEEFLQYKTRVPVRGAIMLNHAMDSVVLVKGWKKGANWSFPRGKINKDEDDLDCAVREVYEETGLDLSAAGLVPTESKPKYIEINMREQQLRLYVFRDVPMDTNFQPRTRKEISKIQWYKLSELPAFRKKGAAQVNNDANVGMQANKFYMVAPFLVPLKKWIVSQKKLEEKIAIGNVYLNPHAHLTADEAVTTEDDTWPQDARPKASQVPPIETLDGATRELQRLLKVQPPTQGLQPTIGQEDKGSALLSILQAGSSNKSEGSYKGGYMPQMPLDHTYTESPQPHNPHHHNNQHTTAINMQQPPPPFGIAPNQPPQSWAGYQAPELQATAPSTFQQFPHGHPASLVHPQPLPPQVQRAMFNNSATQDGPQSSQWGFPGHAQGLGPGAGHESTLPPQTGPHQPAQPQNQSSVQLSGQSMALLSAFKRDTALTRENNAPSQRIEAAAQPQQLGQYQQNHATPQGPQMQPPAIQPPPGSTSQQPADQHRSALLGMFKKAETQPPSHSPLGHSQAQIHLQSNNYSGAPNTALSGAQNAQWQTSVQAHGREVLSASMNQLSIQQQLHQSSAGMPSAAHQTAASRSPSYAGQSPSSRPTQPTRILQRGQEIHELNAPVPTPLGASQQPYLARAGIIPDAAPMPSLGQPTDARFEPPGDQKKQLLSLFAKQASPVARSAQESSQSSQHGSDHTHRGPETPMSPADQTFLLDYLQSVTNKASH